MVIGIERETFNMKQIERKLKLIKVNYLILTSILFFSNNLLSINIDSKYQRGLFLYTQMNFPEAIIHFKDLVAYLKINPVALKVDIETIYYKLGISYLNIKDYDNAISSLMKVLNSEDHILHCKAYIHLGLINSYILDYGKSIKYLNTSLNIIDNLSIDEVQYKLTALNYLGIAYNKAGKYNNAISCYKKELEIDKKRFSNLGRTYLNIANNYFELKDYSKAELYYYNALKEYRKDSVKYNLNLAFAKMNYGRFCTRIGDFKSGISLLYNALENFRLAYGDKHRKISLTFFLLGNSFLDKDLNKSLAFYQKALIAKIHSFNDTLISSNPNIQEIIPDQYIVKFLKAKSNALIKLSETENRQKNLEVALNTLELTTQLIENLHKGFQYEKSRLELLENERKTFSDIIMVSLRLYKLTGEDVYKQKAFRYSEKTRYATLKTQMHDMQLATSAGIPDSLQQKEKDIRIRINRYRSAISETSDKAETDSLNRILFKLYEEQDRLVTFLSNQFPKYHQLKYSDEVLETEDIQKKLSRSDVLVEYLLTDTALVSFILTRQGFEVLCQQVDSSFITAYEEVVKELNTIDTRMTTKSEYVEFVNNTYFLYTILYQPIEHLIKGKRIIVVPDPSLSFLPLGVLISDKPNLLSFEYHKLPFLVKELDINYVFSASLLSNNTSRKWTNSLAAFCPGDEVNSSLFYSKDEVMAISKSFKSDLYLDNLATEESFRKNLDKYDIVHLSMHTETDSTNGHIKLLFEPSADSSDDGKVNFFDIYNLVSGNTLISLSACKTASGLVIKGEGVISLARSFHYAGCPSSLTSLTYIKDYSSAQIIPDFYKHLSKGKRKDVALRLAKRKYFKDKNNFGYRSHPAFWAGLICLGNPTPVTYPKIWIYGVTFILIIAGIAFKRRILDKN